MGKTELLLEAMESRSTIDQAIGILMAQRRCDAEHPFDLLVRSSQAANRKLRDVAKSIVDTTNARARWRCRAEKVPPLPPSGGIRTRRAEAEGAFVPTRRKGG